ncbi:MAG TPA: baseplate J/gp47 family protein, partial [Ktedonobacteraceae bacterium]|nr:baseplate J/gp47 family protein [Ktedonobacteraceae bacterium]
MPWSTPTLAQVRGFVRDAIHGNLPGSDATIANSVLRVMSDVQGALCFLTLEYVDWLSLQLIPDTAEATWLDRHGNIWLVNADGTTGRKVATLASGSVMATSTSLVVIAIPSGSTLTAGNGAVYETMAEVFISNAAPVEIPVRAITPGIEGNQLPGTGLAFTSAPIGANNNAIVVTMDGGNDPETTDELRARVLQRIREPPMGGDQQDYVKWALAVPGVTRAWCIPNGLGIGTIIIY